MLKTYGPLCLFLPKMSAYKRGLIKLNVLFGKQFKIVKKYHEILKNVSNIIKKYLTVNL